MTVLTGRLPDIGLVHAFRERFRQIAVQGNEHRAVSVACEDADGLAAPAFAAVGDTSRVDELAVAMLALAVELANMEHTVPDVTRPPT